MNIMKKGTNQSRTDLSPSVATIFLHSNELWKDLMKFYKLMSLIKMPKINDFDNN